MAATLNQQQQLKNEATKMAIRVPLFYINEKEDTMKIKDFITRFESACTAMGLADQCTA
jgi:flagellar biosynthesis/type III secretory pathway ATPase